MTPDQLTAYGKEYRQTLEAVLDKVAEKHLESLRIAHLIDGAQKTALKVAILDFQTEMKDATIELEKRYQ